MNKTYFQPLKESTNALLKEITRLINLMRKDVERHHSSEDSNPDTKCFITLLPNRERAQNDNISCDILSSLDTKDLYEPLQINKFLPIRPLERFHTLENFRTKGITTDVRCTLYTRMLGSNMESLHFLWKSDPTKDEHANNELTTVKAVDQQVPTYHKEVVKRSFMQVASKLSVKPMKARLLYKVATNDASSASTGNKAAVDQRVLQFCETEDENIVMDLRALNHRPRTFDGFFDTAAKITEGQVDCAVDDRRHDKVVHLAKAISAAYIYR